MGEGRDSVAIRIDEMLRSVPQVGSENCIYKVPNHLREVNPKAYEPEIVSLGPYHRGKDHLKAMEGHKRRYLQLLLQRKEEDCVDRYVKILRELEPRARRCYAEVVSIDENEFIEMMLFDGFFIVELIRKGHMTNLRDADDPIFRTEMMVYGLKHDLLLLENQLPFFVLWKLFDMTKLNREENFIPMIFGFLEVLPGSGYGAGDISADKVKHLLALIHDNWLPSPVGIQAYKNRYREGGDLFMRCATELKEAGVELKKANGQCTLFDIRFEKGTLEIPPIHVQDDTESILRNLLAYEQFPREDEKPDHVVDYVIFMDCLINSASDVELLCGRGIIEHHLGEDDMIARLFNSLGQNVALNHEWSYYSEVFHHVNIHCRRRRNVWLANLRHNYFSSPWTLISVLAATMLLLLTFGQTLYSILSYYKGSGS